MNDDNLLENHKTIWTKTEFLNALTVYDDRYIKM